MSQQSKYKSKCLNNLTQSWKVVKLGSSSCNKRSEQDARAQIGFKPLEGRLSGEGVFTVHGEPRNISFLLLI